MLSTDSAMEEYVILVNEKNETVGVAEKIEAHAKGLLHRAFSVFILNSDNELLLQQRAMTKYHSPGLWSNTCCGHPRPGEHAPSSARRRLMAEMGLDCALADIGSFIYRAEVGKGLVENECDHVFIGYSDDQPRLNQQEAMDWKWISFAALEKELQDNHEQYTFWLNTIIQKHLRSFTLPVEWY